jgi:minichromosome maintenance protein 10
LTNKSDTVDPSNWPPRSPYEALLSSPNGRQKLRGKNTGRQVSVSPLKKSSTTPNLRLRQGEQAQRSDGEDEDEDEETLQLQLAAIEAKLKLKKLQGKKAASRTTEEGIENGNLQQPSSSRSGSLLPSRSSQKGRDGGLVRSKSTAAIQVPVSPTRRAAPNDVAVQRSPSRVLLGIDKGLNGKNVSLRRAPSKRAQSQAMPDPFADTPNLRGGTQPNSRQNTRTEQQPASTAKSFAARMAESRDKEQKAQHQRERLAKMREERSKAFSVDEGELNTLRQAASERLESDGTQFGGHSSRTYSREEVLKGSEAALRPASQVSKKKESVKTNDIRTVSRAGSRSGGKPSLDPREQTELGEPPTEPKSSAESESAAPAVNPEAVLFEPYSSCNLSRRVLPHTFVERTVEGKSAVVIPTLLQSIKSPDYMVPDELVENDYVLFALVASKSAPIEHKKPAPTEKRKDAMTSGTEAQQSLKNEHGNYLVITLTDLKWTLELFLFGPAFVRFRKLTPGTLVAILNPDIMPPPRHLANTGRWSLKLTSAEETVLEIGTSKDLGWCKSIKKDGQPCGVWVDRRHTDYCEFHTNLGVEKLRSGRMNVQGMSALFGPGGRQGRFDSKHGGFGKGDGKGHQGKGKNSNQGRDAGPSFDWGSRSTYYVAKPGGANHSAANLLDADEFMIRGGSQARQRELLAAREKELNIAQSLGLQGDGAGADYLRLRVADNGTKPEQATPGAVTREPRDAKSLGLTGNKSSSILLSPLKRKRSGACDETLASTKKKTRFVTPNGIREAGRDSLNVYDSGSKGRAAFDEDDELDIV